MSTALISCVFIDIILFLKNCYTLYTVDGINSFIGGLNTEKPASYHFIQAGLFQ